MQDLLTAAYDPIFYLHHSFVDRQLAFWQELNTLRKHEIGTFDDMDKPLDPFNRSEYNQVKMTLENNRPKDGFDYKSKFCYEYDSLTFDNMTPEEFLEKENSLNETENTKHIKAGIIMPKNINSKGHTFKICQAEDCEPGIPEYTFGYKDQEDTEKAVNQKSHSILYDDITDIVRFHGWKAEEMEIHMTSTFLTGLPPPLIIIREGEKETALLGQGRNREDYGDLLDTFDSVEE